MKKHIIQFALWLLDKTGHRETLQHPAVPGDLLIQAEKAVLAQAGKGPSGEYRRHQALARLLDAGWKERDAALAIELAVRNVSP